MKKVISLGLIFLLLCTGVVFGETSKNENNVSTWAEDHVNSLQYALSFASDGNLKRTITREEFAELAVAVYERNYGDYVLDQINPFLDTSNSSVRKAKEIGLVNGTSETTYEPEGKLTREQLATIVNNMDMVIEDTFFPEDSEVMGYDDMGDISSWAKGSVKNLVSNGIMQGKGNGKLAPKDTLTIEEACTFLNRALNKREKKATMNPKDVNSNTPKEQEKSSVETMIEFAEFASKVEAVSAEGVYEFTQEEVTFAWDVTKEFATLTIKNEYFPVGTIIVVTDSDTSVGIVGKVESKIGTSSFKLVPTDLDEAFTDYALSPIPFDVLEKIQGEKKRASLDKVNGRKSWKGFMLSIKALSEDYDPSVKQTEYLSGRIPVLGTSENKEEANILSQFGSLKTDVKVGLESSERKNKFDVGFTPDDGYIDTVYIKGSIPLGSIDDSPSLTDVMNEEVKKYKLEDKVKDGSGILDFDKSKYKKGDLVEADDEDSGMEVETAFNFDFVASNIIAYGTKYKVDNVVLYDYVTVEYDQRVDVSLSADATLEEFFIPIYGLSSTTYGYTKTSKGSVTANYRLEVGFGVGSSGDVSINGSFGYANTSRMTITNLTYDNIFDGFTDEQPGFSEFVRQDGIYTTKKGGHTAKTKIINLPYESHVYGRVGIDIDEVIIGPVAKILFEASLGKKEKSKFSFESTVIAGIKITAHAAVELLWNLNDHILGTDTRVIMPTDYRRYNPKIVKVTGEGNLDLDFAIRAKIEAQVGWFKSDGQIDYTLYDNDTLAFSKNFSSLDLNISEIFGMSQKECAELGKYKFDSKKEIMTFSKLPMQIKFKGDKIEEIVFNTLFTDFTLGKALEVFTIQGVNAFLQGQSDSNYTLKNNSVTTQTWDKLAKGESLEDIQWQNKRLSSFTIGQVKLGKYTVDLSGTYDKTQGNIFEMSVSNIREESTSGNTGGANEELVTKYYQTDRRLASVTKDFSIERLIGASYEDTRASYIKDYGDKAKDMVYNKQKVLAVDNSFFIFKEENGSKIESVHLGGMLHSEMSNAFYMPSWDMKENIYSSVVSFTYPEHEPGTSEDLNHASWTPQSSTYDEIVIENRTYDVHKHYSFSIISDDITNRVVHIYAGKGMASFSLEEAQATTETVKTDSNGRRNFEDLKVGDRFGDFTIGKVRFSNSKNTFSFEASNANSVKGKIIYDSDYREFYAVLEGLPKDEVYFEDYDFVLFKTWVHIDGDDLPSVVKNKLAEKDNVQIEFQANMSKYAMGGLLNSEGGASVDLYDFKFDESINEAMAQEKKEAAQPKVFDLMDLGHMSRSGIEKMFLDRYGYGKDSGAYEISETKGKVSRVNVKSKFLLEQDFMLYGHGKSELDYENAYRTLKKIDSVSTKYFGDLMELKVWTHGKVEDETNVIGIWTYFQGDVIDSIDLYIKQ